MDISIITKVIAALSQIPAPALTMLVNGMNPDLVKTLGQWSEAYVQEVNRMVAPVSGPQSGEPNFSLTILDVMNGTTFQGTKLTFADLAIATNESAKAIKAENWKQALMFALSLAGKVGAA